MEAKIVSREETHFTVQVKIAYQSAMLDFEEGIQSGVNAVGLAATQEALSQYDTDGSPIQVGDARLTSKGKEAKCYQTPYGEIRVERHVYQGARGGTTYCPLEQAARIIVTSTPKFAKTVASKYADLGSSRVQADLAENHGRPLARSYIQNISEAVGAVVEAKEADWNYVVPVQEKPIHSVAIGLDGTCMLLCEEGYREAMVGTIALYDRQGERQHTIYMAAAPEYGKQTFLERFEAEIVKVKARYPKAIYVGVADGAKSNWDFLGHHTSIQTLDFWHATEYLGQAANALFRGKKNTEAKQDWLDQACHTLKHKVNAAARLLREMSDGLTHSTLPRTEREALKSAVTYFENNKHRMHYARNEASHLPIGSGVTEAACKVIVKQRLCGSAMKWKSAGAAVVLGLRCLNYSSGKWAQFWQKISQYGLPVTA
jgi:hypothetical protein